MNKKTAIILFFFLILTAGTIGWADHQTRSRRPNQSRQEQPPSKAQLFQEFDKDNDGKLSRADFPGPDAHFNQLDKNQDGFLEKDEMPDGPPRK